MKKIIFIITIAIAAVCSFTGCEKDEEVQYNRAASYSLEMLQQMTEEEYDSYVQNLISETGIDIYKLSKIQPVKKLISQTINSFNVMSCSQTPKSELTESQVSRLQILADSIQLYYSHDDEYHALLLYQEFCSICSNITGFSLNFDDSGIQTITFDGNIINYPVAYLQNDIDQAHDVIDSINNVYPEYSTLSPSVQKEILAATIAVQIRNDLSQQKDISNREACLKAARDDLAISLSAATASYEVALIGCAASSVAAPGCVALASAVYGSSCAVSWWLYKRAIKRR